MKKRNKLYIGISIIFIITLAICYQYYRINLGVPREFNIEKYSMGEVIKLDDFELTANNITIGEDSSDFNTGNLYNLYIVDLTIKNTSNEDKYLKSFYINSLILHDNNTSSPLVDPSSDEMNYLLKSQEEKNIKLTCNFMEINENGIFEFYLPKELYSNEIKSDLKNLKMREKFIELYVKRKLTYDYLPLSPNFIEAGDNGSNASRNILIYGGVI